MEKVFIGLGSNIGNRKKNIEIAIKHISQVLNGITVAPIYVSKAVGYKNQPDFYNTVVSGFTQLSPEKLFRKLKEIEKKTGRIKRFRWGPREIDIDIVFYGSIILETEELIIPHPRAHERDFVLQPLSDIQPEFIHPVFRKTVKELLLNLKNRSIIKKL
ncbi:MAG: 2-amino-4-hydroxy-6-hydroxymethyldihydropteridine diphosphokinase [Persephonella sp.]|nr:2-amino-4-hydroxy-6-hydroxymethyldihydropteridine diphosphokinase [Persephonella sp.]